MADLTAYMKKTKQQVDARLRRLLKPGRTYPARIHQAMRYAVLGGGKRLRPLLVLTGHRMLGGRSRTVMQTACAIEMLHSYSMIHDDLPCMDDDDLRHGQPTVHKKFSDAIAVLAGDALNALAFELLAGCRDRRIPQEIARATGSRGMIGGQVMDILKEGQPVTQREIRYIHSHKTGKLISVCLEVAALEAGAPDRVVKDLAACGMNLGVAFQIIDDILDIRGSEKDLGKPVGSDLGKDKNTYPSVYGLERSEKMAYKLVKDTKKQLARYPRSEILLALADRLVNRIC